MGLEDLIKERAMGPGQVKSKKSIDHFRLSKYEMAHLLQFHPHWAVTWCNTSDEEDIKKWIELIDWMLKRGSGIDALSDSEVEALLNYREELLDYL